MRNEIFAAGAAIGLVACQPDYATYTEQELTSCAEKMMDIRVRAEDARIKSVPSDRPDYDSGSDEFNEMWIGGYNQQILAIASLPVLEDGRYRIYDSYEVGIYADTDSVDFADDDIDYETGNFLTSVDFSLESGLDQTWVDMAITDRHCEELRGWGEFYFEGDRDGYDVDIVSYLDRNGEERY